MTRILAIILTVTIGVVLTISLTGCHVGAPCSDHGGVRWTNGKIYQCNDGTWE